MGKVNLSGISHDQVHRSRGHCPNTAQDHDMEKKPARYKEGDREGRDDQDQDHETLG
jgi:hypothetical protein